MRIMVATMVYLSKIVDSSFLNRVAPSGRAGCSRHMSE